MRSGNDFVAETTVSSSPTMDKNPTHHLGTDSRGTAQEGRLSGKVAVITGGTRGLGLAIARGFLSEGATVLCAARTKTELPSLTTEYGDKRVAAATVDVSSRESVESLMQAAVDRYGRIDILVSNAGVNRSGKVTELSEQDWRHVIDVNLTGGFYCTQAAAAHMQKSGGGRIINISAGMASRVAPGAAAYCASKAALEMFTRVCSVELASKGILVNCISPGFINTGMYEPLQQDEKLRSRYTRTMVLGRPGDPHEVAAAAVFLATDAGSYVNGHVLEVNGGLLWS